PGFSDFEGANAALDGSIVVLSKETFSNYGIAELLLTNPHPGIYKRLHFHVEANGLFMRPGDYTVLTFDSTSDVDATAETAVITGIEARMVPIVDRGNSLSHTIAGSAADTDDRLIYGPIQLSTGDLLPVGLVVDTSYWIAKPSDTGVATDEVAFYATEAHAILAADLPANDDRIGLTAAIGTTNVGGMANNELTTLGVAKTDGYTAFHLDGPIDVTACFSAPGQVTIAGDNAATDVTYWWTP
ncbi:unnamed protein product, partial [marine sediment metagenome]